MNTLESARNQQEAFDLALQEIVEKLKPERVAVLYGYDPADNLIPRATQGLNKSDIYLPGELSLSILQEVLNLGQAKILFDASSEEDYQSRVSTILSGIRSVLCCPILDASKSGVGLLYADSRIQVSAFKAPHLLMVTDLAARLQNKLANLGH